MKKAVLVTLCLMLLCSIGLLINVGTTMAGNPDYTRIEYPTIVEPTVDGKWTSPDEWMDAPWTISENVTFTSTYSSLSFNPITVTTNFVIEISSDNTNDTGDYWQMCMDGNNDGGSAPQTGDYKIEVVGHTNLTVYEGNGTGWTEITPQEGELSFAESISASSLNTTPHWIAEFTILKTAGNIALAEIWGLRLAVFDANNTAAGVWPPDSDPDVPDEWGVNNYTQTPIPEGLTIGVMVLLTSVSVLIGSPYLRNRSRKRKK